MSKHTRLQSKNCDSLQSDISTSQDTTELVNTPAPSLPHSLNALTRYRILQMQRFVGNQAVLRLIQRQDETDADPNPTPPLNEAQVGSALVWYSGQPARYTPAIIQQIRGRVGRSAATGPLTADDVQAIARWQIDNALAERDGKAGTTTLATMFPAGLASDDAIETYASQAHGLEREWQFLDASARQQRLEQLINDRLPPGVSHIPMEIRPGQQPEGVMDYHNWRMLIAQHVVENANGGSPTTGGIPQIDFGSLVNILYHEARHAEQTFMMARMLAGRGQSASYIEHHLEIPEDIATAATQNPLPVGSVEAVIAQGWYDSSYGSGADETDQTYTQVLHALADRNHAAGEAHAHPDEETLGALAGAWRRFRRAVGPYRSLPEEADAFQVEQRVENAYMFPEDARMPSED